MAPPALKKLIASQETRLGEIKGMHTRLLAKPRASLTKTILQARIDALKEIWVEIRKTHSEITVRDDAEGDTYVSENRFGQFEQEYETALDEFLSLLSPFEIADQFTLQGGAPDSITQVHSR